MLQLTSTCDSPYCHLTERSHHKEAESFQSVSLLATVNVRQASRCDTSIEQDLGCKWMMLEVAEN